MPTALTVYANTATSVTLASANQLVGVLANTPTTNTAITTLIGTATGWGEIYSQGNAGAWPALGGIGAPSGHGWLWDVTALEGQAFIASTNWVMTVNLRTSVGTITAQPTIRVYKYNAGVYTQLVSLTGASSSISTTGTNFGVGVGGIQQPVTFVTGDKLYLDCWLNITVNSTGSGAATIAPLEYTNTNPLAGGASFEMQLPLFEPYFTPSRDIGTRLRLALVQDSFIRPSTVSSDAIGNTQGWATSLDGDTWIPSVTRGFAWAIDNNAGVLTSSTQAISKLLGTYVLSDFDLHVRFTTNQATSPFVAGVVARSSPDSSIQYRLYATGSTLAIDLATQSGTTSLTSTPLYLLPNMAYRMRAAASGSVLALKIWADGTDEPLPWSLATFDTTLQTGQIGLYSQLNAPADQITYDTFVATSSHAPLRNISSRFPCALEQDTFNRAPSSSTSIATGWGTTADGDTWSVNNTNTFTFAISGNIATLTGDGTHNITTLLGGHTYTDVEASVLFTMSAVLDVAGIVLRSNTSASTTHYRFRQTNGVFAIVRDLTGTTSTLTSTSFTASVNTTYAIRARAVGSALYSKIWLASSVEPLLWALAANDASITGANQAGFFSGLNTITDTITYDNFIVTNAPNPFHDTSSRLRLRIPTNQKNLSSRLRLQTHTHDISGRLLLSRASDTFIRPDLPSTWGIASDNEQWAIRQGFSTLAIATNTGTLVGSSETAVVTLGVAAPNTTSDLSLVVHMGLLRQNDQAGVVLRATTLSTYYAVALTDTSKLSILKSVSGFTTTLASIAITPPTDPFATFLLRASIATSGGASFLFAKAWILGTTEPTTWMIQATDSSIVGSGWYGLYGQAAQTFDTLAFDTFVANDPQQSFAHDIAYRVRIAGTTIYDMASRMNLGLGTSVLDVPSRMIVRPGKQLDTSTRVRLLIYP